jgi:hypothetical protein
MARLTVLALLLGSLAGAQSQSDAHLKQAGVCARCHVISVVEWGMSAHAKAATDCVACHGVSEGHVIDERNNIKPERMPTGAAIAGFCTTCHAAGCQKTKNTANCQTCHHYHALVDPSKPPAPAEPAIRKRTARPPDATAAAQKVVRVERFGFDLVLVPGGEFDLGNAALPSSAPVHTRRVRPFYLARTEVTVALWNAVLPGSPVPGDPGDPVRKISWLDAQSFLRKLNETVPGGGFRLPTEEEWECAARTNQPNSLGLQAMQGGVWEWCSSLAEPYPYDPSDGRESPGAPGHRVLRGGAFGDAPLDLAFRHSERPDRKLKSNGLRLARAVPSKN